MIPKFHDSQITHKFMASNAFYRNHLLHYVVIDFPCQRHNGTMFSFQWPPPPLICHFILSKHVPPPALMTQCTCCGSSFITPVFPSRMRLFLIAVSFLFSLDGECDVISSFSLGISTKGNKICRLQKKMLLCKVQLTLILLNNTNVFSLFSTFDYFMA